MCHTRLHLGDSADVSTLVGMQLIRALGIGPLQLYPFALILGAFAALVVYRLRHQPKHNTCASCGYALDGLESSICPECGKPHTLAREWDPWDRFRPLAVLVASFIPLLATFPLLVIHRQFYLSSDVNLLAPITTNAGQWLFCTIGAWILMLAHAYLILRLSARHLGMPWAIASIVLAAFANAAAIPFAFLVAGLTGS